MATSGNQVMACIDFILMRQSLRKWCSERSCVLVRPQDSDSQVGVEVKAVDEEKLKSGLKHLKMQDLKHQALAY